MVSVAGSTFLMSLTWHSLFQWHGSLHVMGTACLVSLEGRSRRHQPIHRPELFQIQFQVATTCAPLLASLSSQSMGYTCECSGMVLQMLRVRHQPTVPLLGQHLVFWHYPVRLCRSCSALPFSGFYLKSSHLEGSTTAIATAHLQRTTYVCLSYNKLQ